MDRSLIGSSKLDLDTPALCLDIEVVEANIKHMADYFKDSPVRLRPHTKTHKSPALAHKQMAAGAIGITCAKLGEAEVMAAAGLNDILIANQIIGPVKIARLANLAAYCQVMVAVDDAANIADLNEAAGARGVRLRLLVEIDIGFGRCGAAPGQPSLELARQVAASPHLRFEGVMGYEGHRVMLQDVEERKRKTGEDLARMMDTVELIRRDGIPVEIVSSGGTGTYFITGNYPGITELQVGSYITMDSQYRQEVGMADFDYGLHVLATVISARGSDQAFTDAGLKALTSDFGLPLVVSPTGWEITALSEEHGHLRRVDGPPLKRGDKVEIVPNHGCTTINLHDNYYVTRRGILEAVWPVSARGKTR